MIPQKELDQVIQSYKGELTENALLNKAATLAAQKHVLLADSQLPPALVNAKTKPLSQELTKLTKASVNFLEVQVWVPLVDHRERKRRKKGIW